MRRSFPEFYLADVQLAVVLDGGRGVTVASGALRMLDFFDFTGTVKHFTVPLQCARGSATVTGTLSFANVYQFVQLVEGLLTDKGVQKGRWLIESTPKGPVNREAILPPLSGSVPTVDPQASMTRQQHSVTRHVGSPSATGSRTQADSSTSSPHSSSTPARVAVGASTGAPAHPVALPHHWRRMIDRAGRIRFVNVRTGRLVPTLPTTHAYTLVVMDTPLGLTFRHNIKCGETDQLFTGNTYYGHGAVSTMLCHHS
jgi:hypothetical protein